MNLFGKSVGDYVSFARAGTILIVAMGVLRFAVGASGVPYEQATHLESTAGGALGKRLAPIPEELVERLRSLGYVQ